MKELTIEQKAQRYDEVIESGKSLLSSNQLGNAWIYKLLPELKENEDEKLREQVVYAINQLHVCECTKNKLLAWLEKQGEQPKEATYTHEVETGNGNIKALVTEKVQLPKFHEGEWVTIDGWNYHIEEVSKACYKLSDINGNHTMLPHFAIDDYYRLWTINDVKDGDVLCSEQIIILFKKWEYNDDWNLVIAYAGIDTTGRLQITDKHWFISSYAHPATKEQSDLLFQNERGWL